LSTTTGYYSETFPTVSGAVVTVTNSSNQVFIFTETATAGEYLCTNFQPVIGETYIMSVALNGETYTASEKLIPTSAIEPDIDQTNTGGMTGDEIEITYYYQDIPNEESYYLNRIVTPQVAFPQFAIESDELSQNNRIPQSYSHEDLDTGDSINITLYGISKSYFNYFNKLQIAAGNGGGGPFQTTPTAVRGNIVNQTNVKNFAFGYFRLCEVTTRNYIAQ
jgi:uncharacterized protein DUF4249